MGEPNDSRTERPMTRWGPWGLFAGSIVILLVGAWLRRHTLDDSFINYRIVHQIEAGNGPVFNVGERVEAFTSVLWLALLTISDAVLPVRLEWIGMIGGIVLGALGLLFAGLGSRLLFVRDDRDASPVMLPIGALVAAAFPPVYRLIASGLEDGLTMAWLGGCMWALGRWHRSGDRLGLPSAALIGIGVLVRPDLAPFTIAFVVAVLVGDRHAGRGRTLCMLVVTAALPVASQILRMGYFGLLTPNTAIAKSADLTRWGMGWHYLTDTIVPYGFWIPVVALVVIGYVPLFARTTSDGPSTRRAWIAAAFLASSALSMLYIVRLGGDYMQARLLLPAIFGFLTPVAFVPWPDRARRRSTGIASIGFGVIAVAWIVVCGLFVRTSSDDRAVLFESRNAVTLGDFQRTSPGPIAPAVGAGQVFYMYNRLPYASARGSTPIVIELGVGKVAYALPDDVYILDALGLANPIAGHEKLRVRGWPGHEKLLTEPWIAALSTAPGSPVTAADFPRPNPIRNGSVLIVFHDQGDAAGRPFTERVETARGVLGCAEMRRFRASYTAPMTPRRFIDNFLDAFSNQRIVVSGEPAIAAESLCTGPERARIERAVAAGQASR
ncbi:MAG: hypothetical protein JST73_10305 [Actinobacteria bacterium]|nr:hypothetical protein [Actinomycetota bacterium]